MLWLFSYFENQGRFDRALAIMTEMDGAGVKPDVNTYRILIFACSMCRDQDRADQVTNLELLVMSFWGKQPHFCWENALLSLVTS